MNLLECKICGYKEKQLHPHHKAKHNMSSSEYRNIYGDNKIMQLGFTPNKPTLNIKHSNEVKRGA